MTSLEEIIHNVGLEKLGRSRIMDTKRNILPAFGIATLTAFAKMSLNHLMRSEGELLG